MSHEALNSALAALTAGGMVILTDDVARENEGDLCMAAAHVRAQDISFMARHGRGLICAPMACARGDALDLPLMVPCATPGSAAAFTVTIDAAHGIGSGISSADRAHTLRLAADPKTLPQAFVRPGHVFPLRAAKGGVLRRPGHTEGALDLLALAGLGQVAVICEVLNDDGTVAQTHDLAALAQAHRLPMVAIADVVAARLGQEALLSDPIIQGPTVTFDVATLGAQVVVTQAHVAHPSGAPPHLSFVQPHQAEPTLHVALQGLAASLSHAGHRQLVLHGLAAQAVRAMGYAAICIAAPPEPRVQRMWAALGLAWQLA